MKTLFAQPVDQAASDAATVDHQGPVNSRGQTLWAITAAFGTYFCMYGFRVPFKAAGYDESVSFWGLALDEKSLFVISQVLGYMLSKFLGIKVIPELPPERRAGAILMFIGMAELALLSILVLPRNFIPLAFFLNGLPLGMVFGLVLGFLEGRRTTELLAAGLCISFILADGVMKSIGQLLIPLVGELAMPAVAGACFVPPLLLCVWMLTRIPRPNAADVRQRQPRVTMDRAARLAYLRRYGLALAPIVLIYLLATILRSVRGDFAREIWAALGVDPNSVAELYTRSELWVGAAVLTLNGGCALFVDNRRAYRISLGICLLGGGLLFAACMLQPTGGLEPLTFMILIGLGLYLPYVAVHTTVLERFIALTGERGNLGYLMYIVDATGYLGYVVVLLVQKFVGAQTNMLQFVVIAGTAIGAAFGVLVLIAAKFSSNLSTGKIEIRHG